MKTLATLLLSAAITPFASGQGPCLHFANLCNFATVDPTGGNRLVYDVGSPLDPVNGTKLSGTQYAAELYVGLSESSLVPIPASICRFRSSTSANKGAWASTTIAGQSSCLDLGLPPGSVVVLQVKVWDISQFATYEQAVGHGKTGSSKAFTYTPPTPTDPLPDTCMEGLHAFALTSGASLQLATPTIGAGGFRFKFGPVLSGTTNHIQCSSNLADWVTLATNIASADTISFADSVTNAASRFYRVKQIR